MSELIDNDAQRRKELLKHLILQTAKRALAGEQRLLSWSEERGDA